MQGITVFKTVEEAVARGYQVVGRTEDGVLVRMRTSQGWAMALVSNN